MKTFTQFDPVMKILSSLEDGEEAYRLDCMTRQTIKRVGNEIKVVKVETYGSISPETDESAPVLRDEIS